MAAPALPLPCAAPQSPRFCGRARPERCASRAEAEAGVLRCPGSGARPGVGFVFVWDVPVAGLNLFEGDILLPRSRSALRSENLRWKLPIPFILHNSLDLNAKGVILKAFEGFGLKSCVQFKPYEGESSFIMFQKSEGCWSSLGDLKTGQNLSVGEGCDNKGTVSHEILHALGFYHEQARTDRDDYIKIWWDHILPDQAFNFQKYSNDHLTDFNTPYDYESIMHYGPFSFSKNKSLPTVTANIHEFNGVIGQRLDFSSTDLQRLNQMHNCTRPLTLLDQCDFESADICGLVQDLRDEVDWTREKSNFENRDHTLGGKCNDSGYFMFFNTSYGEAGETAILKSRILTPRRMQQCLQFFFKTTGSPDDKLVIWVMKDDSSGTIRKLVKLQTFQGESDQNWKIAHVPIRVRERFRYLFQGQKGRTDLSSGGILIDDVTLSETRCPNAVWHINNFTHLLNTAAPGDTMLSPRFYSPEGYAYGLTLRVLGGSGSETYTGISFHLTSGENDGVLEWPALNRQATITILDQHADVRKRLSIERSFTTEGTRVPKGKIDTSRWGNPSIHGKFDPVCNCSRGKNWGWSNFATHELLRQRNYLKNDVLVILVDFEDLTHLKDTERSLPQTWHRSHNLPPARRKRLAPLEDSATALSEPCDPNPCQNDGVCVSDHERADCRCATSQIFFYTGERCQVPLGWWEQMQNGYLRK
ncbi:PREDICTED: meprin A subunit alpha-like [Gekko japonicus]|uniref:Meprin A subunit n=1 Tax=Gekko japonicus TaxID=146911 RepID=A0ABM1KBH9_GEKJA|nr:PREDICTED: meprin A subunit alpha-like [Gekko japonicus]